MTPLLPILAMAGAFFMGVEAPRLLHFPIALLTVMVAATFVPPVRRARNMNMRHPFMRQALDSLAYYLPGTYC